MSWLYILHTRSLAVNTSIMRAHVQFLSLKNLSNLIWEFDRHHYRYSRNRYDSTPSLVDVIVNAWILTTFVDLVSRVGRCEGVITVHLSDDNLRGWCGQEGNDKRHRHERADDAKLTDTHHQLKQTRDQRHWHSNSYLYSCHLMSLSSSSSPDDKIKATLSQWKSLQGHCTNVKKR